MEAALYAALRALKDRTELARVRPPAAEARGLAAAAERFRAEAEAHAAAVRAALRLDGRAGLGMRTDQHPAADPGVDPAAPGESHDRPAKSAFGRRGLTRAPTPGGRF